MKSCEAAFTHFVVVNLAPFFSSNVRAHSTQHQPLFVQYRVQSGSRLHVICIAAQSGINKRKKKVFGRLHCEWIRPSLTPRRKEMWSCGKSKKSPVIHVETCYRISKHVASLKVCRARPQHPTWPCLGVVLGETSATPTACQPQ